MSIKNFKNPWGEGGEYYPDWLGGEKVLSIDNSQSISSISPPSSDSRSGYYNRHTGDYLGTDNLKNNKVFVADKFEDSKKGSEKFINAEPLNVKHDVFIKMAGVINGESSGNKEESLALGTAIINAANNGGWSLEKLLSSSDFTRAILSSRYKDFINAAHNKRHAFLSCINAFKYQSGEFDAIDLKS